MPLSLCAACGLPSDKAVSTLPCEECLASLLIAQKICRYCLGLGCELEACLRPWMRVEGDGGIRLFDSITAAYLSLGPGASVLKSWKKSGSPALQRALTQGVARALDPDTSRPLVLIPVPQSSSRKWALNGGSVLRLCEMIGRGEILELLAVYHSPESNQARMKGDGRYRREASIRLSPSLSSKTMRVAKDLTHLVDPEILLVDDFLTSGATLRSALEATRLGFEELGLFSGRNTRVGAFVLGFRPSLSG